MFKKLILTAVAVAALGTASTFAEARKAALCDSPPCGVKASNSMPEHGAIDPNYRTSAGGLIDSNFRRKH